MEKRANRIRREQQVPQLAEEYQPDVKTLTDTLVYRDQKVEELTGQLQRHQETIQRLASERNKNSQKYKPCENCLH